MDAAHFRAVRPGVRLEEYSRRVWVILGRARHALATFAPRDDSRLSPAVARALAWRRQREQLNGYNNKKHFMGHAMRLEWT